MTTIVREFVSLESPSARRAGAGGRPCQGLYHRAEGTSPKVAVIATHYEVDFSEHYLAEYLAVRGIAMLGWNTRYRGAGMYFNLGPALADIGRGVRWLREQSGIESVVILGNSGGASLMSAYHAEALTPTLDGVGQSEPGDLFISLNAHAGRPDVLTSWLDPSVTDEGDPLSVNRALDMFNPEHGPPYKADFIARYRAAQVARNERITEWCRSELVRLSAGGGSERVFQVPRTWADLRFLDLTIEPSERGAGCYAGDARTANYGPFGLAAANTCRSWLAMWSLSDSHCRAEPHLAKVTVPALVVQSTGDQGCYRSDGVGIHRALGSDDKTFAEVAGDHYFLSPGGARETVADLITGWIGART